MYIKYVYEYHVQLNIVIYIYIYINMYMKFICVYMYVYICTCIDQFYFIDAHASSPTWQSALGNRALWGAPAPPWDTAAAALGPGGDTSGWGHLKRLYKAPTNYIKPQNIIQSPNRLYKDIKYQTNHKM